MISNIKLAVFMKSGDIFYVDDLKITFRAGKILIEPEESIQIEFDDTLIATAIADEKGKILYKKVVFCYPPIVVPGYKLHIVHTLALHEVET